MSKQITSAVVELLLHIDWYKLTNSFQIVLTNSGLALQLCLMLTVSGLFIARKKILQLRVTEAPFTHLHKWPLF